MKVTLFDQKYKNTHRYRLKNQPLSTKARKNSEIFLQAKTKGLMTVINPSFKDIIRKSYRKDLIDASAFVNTSLSTPNQNITSKPLNARMGKGKGSISKTVRFVQQNKTLFQFHAPSEMVSEVEQESQCDKGLKKTMRKIKNLKLIYSYPKQLNTSALNLKFNSK